MTYRVEVVRTVRQVGFVDLEAATEAEARECAIRMAKQPGHGALAPTWTEDIRMGQLEISDVREAA